MATDTESNSSLRQRVSSHTDSRITTYLLLAGVVLFVIPEPITSFLGIFVLLLGLVAWVFDTAL